MFTSCTLHTDYTEVFNQGSSLNLLLFTHSFTLSAAAILEYNVTTLQFPFTRPSQTS